MKKKRRIVSDKQTVAFILTGAFFGFGSYVLFSEKDIAIGITFAVFAAVFIIVPLIFMPCCYIFDSEGVSAHYLFLPDERWLWDNIRSIKLTYDYSARRGLFALLFSRVYEINGKTEGKVHRYMNGYIRKSRRAKRLIEKYWDGEITGGFWYNRRKKREEKEKEKLNISYGTDEANATERELRKNAKEWLVPFEESASEAGLTLTCRFVFVTDDLTELNSRPRSTYTYTILTDISRKGDTPKDNILSIDFELAYVRLGKTAYRAFANKSAKEELTDTLTEILDDIKANGIEKYISDQEL